MRKSVEELTVPISDATSRKPALAAPRPNAGSETMGIKPTLHCFALGNALCLAGE
jgi:hypothetical protein